MRRLDQLLASLGYCSRSEARDWVRSGAVTVRGEEADDFGERVNAADVRVDGEPLDHPDGLLLLLHKPLGLVCSHDGREGPNVYSLLPARWQRRNPQVTSVGRLDKDTSGLLLLTDQPPLVHRLTSPKHKVPKVYRATVDRDLSPDLIPRFAAGTLRLEDDEEPCAPAGLKIISPREAELTLTEGRYHQVRRMFAACGWTVLALHRASFGALELGDLAASGGSCPWAFSTGHKPEMVRESRRSWPGLFPESAALTKKCEISCLTAQISTLGAYPYPDVYKPSQPPDLPAPTGREPP
jgi:16S rRNA pseudouridine516 synthase